MHLTKRQRYGIARWGRMAGWVKKIETGCRIEEAYICWTLIYELYSLFNTFMFHVFQLFHRMNAYRKDSRNLRRLIDTGVTTTGATSLVIGLSYQITSGIGLQEQLG